MRRDGLLTGYLWSRNSPEKVKVKAKPTNASKVSGRCGRARCSSCHDRPVSKAKSKTKGRNKRALSRVLVDDEWAFCKRAPTGRAKAVFSVLSHVDSFNLDACRSDAELFGHDVDDDAYNAYDACPPEANPLGQEVNDSDLDADDANEIHVAGDVSDAGMHAHDDVKDVGMLMRAAAPQNGDYKMHSGHVFGPDGKLDASTYAIPIAYAENLEKVAPDVNTGICAKAIDVVVVIDDDEDDDVTGECHSTMAHAENDVVEGDEDVANDTNANEESHVIMVHAADDVSSNDDYDDDDENDLYNDEDADGFQSLISGLTNVMWPICNSNEVFEVESEENSLSGDWCYVADSSDAIDDWYLC